MGFDSRNRQINGMWQSSLRVSVDNDVKRFQRFKQLIFKAQASGTTGFLITLGNAGSGTQTDD